jgi:hypothetical protein
VTVHTEWLLDRGVFIIWVRQKNRKSLDFVPKDKVEGRCFQWVLV